jgi:tight adherence protein C
MEPILVSVLVLVGVLLIVFGLTSSQGKSPVQERLAEYGAHQATLEEIELSLPFSERMVKPLINSISAFVTRFLPKQYVEAARVSLERAGNPHGWTATYFLGIRGLIMAVCFFGPFLLMSIAGMAVGQRLLLSLLIGLLGFNLPTFYLGSQAKGRQNKVLRALPDVLDLLTISVEAGLAFDAAVAKVSEKWDNELSRLFQRMLTETRMGVPRREAMRNMANRVNVPEVTAFVAAIIQADQLGVSIAKVLRIQSEQMRVRRRQRAEEKAMRAPLLMSFPLVVLIFPSIYIILLGPSALIFLRSGMLGSLF